MGLLSKAISSQVVTDRRRGLLHRITVMSRASDAIRPSYNPAARPPEAAPTPLAGGWPTHVTSGGGLLRKSLIIRQPVGSETVRNESLLVFNYAEDNERLKRKINGFAKDFSYFPSLFSLLVHELRLPQAAFFLFHAPCRAFAPWMSRGMGADLIHNMLFTEIQWQEQRLSPEEPSFLADGRRLFPALSARPLGPVCLFPLAERGSLTGGLFVFNLPLHPESRSSLFALFRSLAGAVAPTVAGLTRILRDLPQPERIFTTPLEALTGFLKRPGGAGETIHIMLLPLSPFVDSAAERFDCLNAVRLREMITYAINGWLGGLGAGVPVRPDVLFLVARDQRCYGPRLLVRFISDHVKDLFTGLFDSAASLHEAHAIECPADSEIDPEAILSRLGV